MYVLKHQTCSVLGTYSTVKKTFLKFRCLCFGALLETQTIQIRGSCWVSQLFCRSWQLYYFLLWDLCVPCPLKGHTGPTTGTDCSLCLHLPSYWCTRNKESIKFLESISIQRERGERLEGAHIQKLCCTIRGLPSLWICEYIMNTKI